LAYYSGQFHQQGFGWADREASRVVYVDETNTLKLAYCNPVSAWTISWKSASSPCEYIFRSQDTESFDIVEVAGGSWFVQRALGDVPVDWLKLFCNDCNDEICNPEHGSCARDDSKGSTLNKCVCHEALTWNASRPVGLNCELVADCHFFAIDTSIDDSLSPIPGASFLKNLEFHDLGLDVVNDTSPELEQGMMMHHRPIYGIHDEAMKEETYLNAFMMFTGRRWGLFTALLGAEEQGNAAIKREEFIKFLIDNDSANKPIQTLKNISLTYSHFEPRFFTLPMNYGEESYDRWDGIPWVGTKKAGKHTERDTIISRFPDDNKQLPVRYLCSDCVSYE
jgi:hypothetical protein